MVSSPGERPSRLDEVLLEAVSLLVERAQQELKKESSELHGRGFDPDRWHEYERLDSLNAELKALRTALTSNQRDRPPASS